MKRFIIWLLAVVAWILFAPTKVDAAIDLQQELGDDPSYGVLVTWIADHNIDLSDCDDYVLCVYDTGDMLAYAYFFFPKFADACFSKRDDAYLMWTSTYGSYYIEISLDGGGGSGRLNGYASFPHFDWILSAKSSRDIYFEGTDTIAIAKGYTDMTLDKTIAVLSGLDASYQSGDLTLSWTPKYVLPLPADQKLEADNLRLKLDATVYYPESGVLQSKDINMMSYNDLDPVYDYNASYTIPDLIAYLTAKHNLPGAVALELKASYTQKLDGVVKYGPAASARVALDRGYYWDSSGMLKKNTSQLDSKAVPTPQNFLVQRASKNLKPDLFYESLNDPPDGWTGKWPIFIPDLTTGRDEFVLTWTPPTEDYTLNIFASLLLRQADGSYRELQVPYIGFDQAYPASTGKLVLSQQDLFAHVAVSKDLVGLIPDTQTQDYLIKSPVKVYVRYLSKDPDGNVVYGNAVTFTYNKETTGTIQYGEEAVDDESGGSMVIPDSEYNDQNSDWSGTNADDINTTINGFLDAITKLPQLISKVFSSISGLFKSIGQVPLLLAQLFPIFPPEFYTFFLIFLLISLVIGIFRIFRG